MVRELPKKSRVNRLLSGGVYRSADIFVRRGVKGYKEGDILRATDGYMQASALYASVGEYDHARRYGKKAVDCAKQTGRKKLVDRASDHYHFATMMAAINKLPLHKRIGFLRPEKVRDRADYEASRRKRGIEHHVSLGIAIVSFISTIFFTAKTINVYAIHSSSLININSSAAVLFFLIGIAASYISLKIKG